jgi:hypothetical protein
MRLTGQRLVVFGGDTMRPTGYTTLSDVWLYDPGSRTWAELPPPAGAMGGRLLETSTDLLLLAVTGETWRLDPRRHAWEPKAGPATLPDCTDEVVSGSEVIRLCGKKIERLDLVKGNWPVHDLPGEVLPGAGLVAAGRWLLLWGGYRLGPSDSDACANAPPGSNCLPPGPPRVPSDEGWLFAIP